MSTPYDPEATLASLHAALSALLTAAESYGPGEGWGDLLSEARAALALCEPPVFPLLAVGTYARSFEIPGEIALYGETSAYLDGPIIEVLRSGSIHPQTGEMLDGAHYVLRTARRVCGGREITPYDHALTVVPVSEAIGLDVGHDWRPAPEGRRRKAGALHRRPYVCARCAATRVEFAEPTAHGRSAWVPRYYTNPELPTYTKAPPRCTLDRVKANPENDA